MYNIAKVTVICAENEPFGLVPVESMSYGTPVIAHNSGGPTETITHKKNGFLYNSPLELQQYLKKIINLPDSDYEAMSTNAKKRASYFFTKNIATNFIKLLSNLTH